MRLHRPPPLSLKPQNARLEANHTVPISTAPSLFCTSVDREINALNYIYLWTTGCGFLIILILIKLQVRMGRSPRLVKHCEVSRRTTADLTAQTGEAQRETLAVARRKNAKCREAQ